MNEKLFEWLYYIYPQQYMTKTYIKTQASPNKWLHNITPITGLEN